MAEKKEEGKITKKPDNKDVEENKLWAILAYLWILALIPYFGKKESKFAQFHGKQGMVLLILSVISWVLGVIFGFIPVLNILYGLIIMPLFGLFLLVLSIIGIINAVKGEMKELPLTGKLVDTFQLK